MGKLMGPAVSGQPGGDLPQPSTQGAGLICQAVKSASRGGTRKQNKNKKVNYLWLFLNKYPNWPSRILHFGGREKKEEKKTFNQIQQTPILSWLPSLCLSLLDLSLIGGRLFHINSQIFKCKSVV